MGEKEPDLCEEMLEPGCNPFFQDLDRLYRLLERLRGLLGKLGRRNA